MRVKSPALPASCHCDEHHPRHREERSDVAIPFILSLSKDANEIATLRS